MYKYEWRDAEKFACPCLGESTCPPINMYQCKISFMLYVRLEVKN